ncbi:MAG: hypothetical protein K2X47_15820 [Bdellovibrionales bacterium]|nr:hypothetical protein [Bdellovibrionales bacterium]
MSKVFTAKTRDLLISVTALGLLVSCGKGPGFGNTLKKTVVGQSPNMSPDLVQGGNSSGGGDAFTIEFKKLAEDMVSAANWKDSTVIEGVEIARLRGAVQETQIKTVDFELQHPDLDGVTSQDATFVHPLCIAQDPNKAAAAANTFAHRVDAINCRDQKLIVLSLVNWKSWSLQQKRRLVIHEYFGILKIADKNYEASSRFLNSLKLVSTVRDTTVIGTIADSLISKIQWKATEITQEELQTTGKAEEKDFQYIARRFELKDSEAKRSILICESGTGSVSKAAGTKVVVSPVGPPSECKFIAERSLIRDGHRIEFQLDAKAYATIFSRLGGDASKRSLDLGAIVLTSGSDGGIISLDLAN